MAEHLRAAEYLHDSCNMRLLSVGLCAPAIQVLELHNKGVRVRIISDNDQAHTQGSDIDKFRQAGIAVRQDKTAAHMHHKFGEPASSRAQCYAALLAERTCFHPVSWAGAYNPLGVGLAWLASSNTLCSTAPACRAC